MGTELLASDELAAELKVPKATLDQWAYRRVGPAFIKIGRHRRYRRVDVEYWLDIQTVMTDPAPPPPIRAPHVRWWEQLDIPKEG